MFSKYQKGQNDTYRNNYDSMNWSSSDEMKVGDRVKITKECLIPEYEGMKGKIRYITSGILPYSVDFDNGEPSSVFRKEELEKIK